MMNELESCDGDDEIGVVNTEQRVQDALTSLDTVADEVIITSLQSDIEKRERQYPTLCV